MATSNTGVVLITGCSSGIGRELVRQLGERGHRVAATARKPETLRDLQETGVTVHQLDVTDEESIQAAVAGVMDAHGRIDILINNAGFGLIGPTAELPMEDIRRQFETNVFGPLALIQAVAPVMARQGSGSIINMGSVSGITATPWAGPYCASKAALHLFSDALRMELAPFGISVVTVQPGGIRSQFSDSAANGLKQLAETFHLYRNAAAGMEARARMSQDSPTSTKDFVWDMLRVVLRPDAPAVYRAGHGANLMPGLKRWLPTATLDNIMAKRFGLKTLMNPLKK